MKTKRFSEVNNGERFCFPWMNEESSLQWNVKVSETIYKSQENKYYSIWDIGFSKEEKVIIT